MLRCLALAAFLAELAASDSRSAIVFDDPVSSLDHMHRVNVAKRHDIVRRCYRCGIRLLLRNNFRCPCRLRAGQ